MSFVDAVLSGYSDNNEDFVLYGGPPVMEPPPRDNLTSYKPFGERLEDGGLVLQGDCQSYNNCTSANVTAVTPENDLFSVTPGILAVLSILYGSISAVTVVGNFLVILVIAKNKAMRTVTNFFIANLSVADVIIGIFGIPFQFQAALLQRWDLPAFLCPIAPFVKEMTVNVSIITLAVISIDRYVAVIHPLRPRCSSRVATGVMAVVWIFSVTSALTPLVVYRTGYDPDGVLVCIPKHATIYFLKSYSLYLIVIQYFLPLLIISFAYMRIMHKIWFTKAPGSAVDTRDQMLNRNKRKVIKMLIIVVALFALCWLPLQSYNLLAHILPAINNYRYINVIWFCSNWLAMSNSCYNPFIYGLCNEKFKHSFRVLFRKCPCLCMKRDGRYPYGNDTRFDYSEDTYSYRMTHNCHEDTRLQFNGNRCKRYMRVNLGDVDSKDASHL